MPRFLLPRLAALMFLLFVAIGAWLIPLTTYLLKHPDHGGLGFPAGRVGLLYNTIALAGLFAPFVAGLVADRFVSAEKLLAGLSLAGAGLLALVARACEHHAPLLADAFAAGRGPAAVDAATGPLFGLLLAYNVTMTANSTLAVALCLRHLPDPERQFGPVRLFGTLGWVVCGLAVGGLLKPVSSQPLWLASASTLALAAYSLTLPPTPPAGRGRSLADALGLPALALFRRRSFAVFGTCALLLTVLNTFYNLFFNKYLHDLGYESAAALQTVGQVTEVVCLLLLPAVLNTLGLKWTLAVGILGWLTRYAVFAAGWPPLVLGLGLPLHGVSFVLFFIVAQVYLDREAPPHLRTAAQGLFAFITSGAGMLMGNLLSGAVVDLCTSAAGHTDWQLVWRVPAAVAAVALGLFVALFPRGPVAAPARETTLNAAPEPAAA